jgi:hypothetical protein
MRLHSFSLVVASLFVAALSGCGSSGGSDSNNGNPPPPPPGDQDAGPTDQDAGPPAPPPPDHGAPSDTYPAFKPDVGQIVDNGGGVLKSPKIVTVTWPNDTDAPELERFGDEIGQTNYWKAITSEYGVGPGTSGAANHIRMTTPLGASVADSDLDAIVTANATQTAQGSFTPDASKWPAPTNDTVYILYIPPSTSLNVQGGDACTIGVGGYHSNTQAGIVYAIVPPCAFMGTRFEDTTQSASHELAEAALDPRPQSTPGFTGVDTAHYAWESFQQGQSENGDMCEFYRDSFYTETGDVMGDFKFAVQRQWSNKSIVAGHSPCVPQVGTYFNTTLITPEQVAIDLSSMGGSTKEKVNGVHIPVGQTKTFEIGFYSDAPMDAWTISAHENNPVLAGQGGKATSHFKATIDKTSGKNGEKALVTVQVTAPGRRKGELLVISSQKGAQTHYMPIMIGSE